jgi:hypothetical protein
MRKINILVGVMLGLLIFTLIASNFVPAVADLFSADKVLNQVRHVTGSTAPVVALLTSTTPGQGVQMTASGILNDTAGLLWAMTINPVASQTWSLTIYNDTVGSGTIIYKVSGLSGTTTSPITVAFPVPLKATGGMYATFVQSTASFLYEP